MFNLIHNKINAKQNSEMQKWQRSEYLITDIWLRENRHTCTLAGGVHIGTSVTAIWQYILKLKVDTPWLSNATTRNSSYRYICVWVKWHRYGIIIA